MTAELTPEDSESLARITGGHVVPFNGHPCITCAVQAEVARIVGAARAKVLRDTADVWQWGAWANAPRLKDVVEERIANAQFVTDWLRERADGEGS